MTPIPSDGCWLSLTTYIGSLSPVQHIDWVDAINILFKRDELVTVEAIETRFSAVVRLMPNEDYTFVMQAYRQFSGPSYMPISFAERMALARVCRRIIREAKESEAK